MTESRASVLETLRAETVADALADLMTCREVLEHDITVLQQAEVLIVVAIAIIEASGYTGLDAERWLREAKAWLGPEDERDA